MKKVITYGTFDLLHRGHVNLLKRARALGDYLIVGVTSSDFDKHRGKINVRQSLMERIEAIKATGLADEVIPEEYYGQKIDDIRNLDIDIFAIGSDWEGHFDYLKEYCEVVYLDRTEGISSTQLRDSIRHVSLGIVGASSDVCKFISECRYVSGVDVVGVFPDGEDCPEAGKMDVVDSLEALLEMSDAIYVNNRPDRRSEIASIALSEDKHVLCESPVALRRDIAENLFGFASEKDLVFQEAIKTAYALGFSRLVLLVKSGMIGQVVSIRSTCTSLSCTSSKGSLIEWGPIACLPIFEILGIDYIDARAVSMMGAAEDIDLFTKLDFTYASACASIEVGIGAKSEGDLVITGTKGYVYVPSPWWKTDYFEVRFEDFANNKRYFYQLNGEGIRDEVLVFIKSIQDEKKPSSNIAPSHTIAFAGLIGDYEQRKIPFHAIEELLGKTTTSFFQS